MELKVFIEKDNKIVSFKTKKKTITVSELLENLNILSSASIVTKNNEIVTEDEILSEKDNIKILSVISGG